MRSLWNAALHIVLVNNSSSETYSKRMGKGTQEIHFVHFLYKFPYPKKRNLTLNVIYLQRNSESAVCLRAKWMDHKRVKRLICVSVLRVHFTIGLHNNTNTTIGDTISCNRYEDDRRKDVQSQSSVQSGYLKRLIIPKGYPSNDQVMWDRSHLIFNNNNYRAD